MDKKWCQSFWLLSSILLIGAGVLCILNPQNVFSAFSWIILLVIFIKGIADLIGTISLRDTLFSNVWLLIDAILSSIMVIYLGVYQETVMISYAFSGWLLMTSLAGSFSSFQMKRLNFESWNWLCAFSIVGLAFSIFAFFNPFLALLTMRILLGAILIYQGFITLVRWFLCLAF